MCVCACVCVCVCVFTCTAYTQTYSSIHIHTYAPISTIEYLSYDVIWVYFSVSSYSIAFLGNCLITLDIKIDKRHTCLNATHSNLLLKDRPKSCNFIKKETLAQMFSYEFCSISRNKLFYRTHIRATVFGLSFVNPRKKSVKELV